jgi:hypothetical protein
VVRSEQKRQKKLAKQRSKEIKKRREVAQAKQRRASLAGRMEAAARGPVHECLVGCGVQGAEGMGHVTIARSLPSGRIAVAVFLIDALCLGVKDVFGREVSITEYRELTDRLDSMEELTKVPSSHARSLVESAIRYAESFGFAPHADYRKVAPIWGDIDASECDQVFEFGKNGRPVFMRGPGDSQEREWFIINRLAATVGAGNFVVGSRIDHNYELEAIGEDDDDEEDEDEDEGDDSSW